MGTCTVIWDRDNPLARCTGETRRASQGLVDYAFMGGSRGQRGLHMRYTCDEHASTAPTQSYTTIMAWSVKYGWVERVERWEEIQAENKAATWKERQDRLREQEWDMHDRLNDRAEEMLKHPIVQQTITKEETLPDGKTLKQIIIVEPTGWTQRDAATMSKTASDLGRRAAGMETERVAETRTIRLVVGGIDLEEDI